MNLRAVFELIFLGALWGGSFLFMRIAAPEFGPVALIEVRVSVAAFLLLALMGFRGELSTLRQHWWQLVFLGAVNSAIPFTLYAFAVLRLPSGLTSVLNATAPLFGILVAFVWLRQRQPLLRIIGVLIGFAGVIVLVWGKLSLQGDYISVGAGLLAAFLYGIAANFSKRHLAGVPSLTVSAGSLLAASLMLLPLAATNLPTRMPGSLSLICALVLGVACTGLAYLLFFRLLANIGVSRAITVAYLIPVFGMLWGSLFLKETISFEMIAGGTIVLLGVAMVNLPDPPKKQVAATA